MNDDQSLGDNGNKDTLIKIETNYSWKMGPLVQGTKRIMVKLVMEGQHNAYRKVFTRELCVNCKL